MNQILKIVERRKLYIHLILFRVYIENEGRTDKGFHGNLQNEIQDLLNYEFKTEDYNTALEYLFSKGYTKYSNAECLTVEGRDYVENWASEFEILTVEEREELKSKLPERVVKFFKIMDKAHTVLSFIEKLQQFT
ncbi:hypothetical protein [Cellulophaga baltica]|uniref:hypothetical protein n=1 Tax=Cellulophaga baltica TaxID=76594 RepID=UPI002494F46B|nr:hypothetical protein [Cellulophaga baltica]